MKMEVGIYRVSEELIGKDFVGAEIAQSNETWSYIVSLLPIFVRLVQRLGF